MKPLRALLVLPILAFASACSVPVPEEIYSTCKATSAGEWKAWIEREPRFKGGKPKRKMLVVTGKVEVPDGIEPRLELGPVEKVEPRAQQLLLRTEGKGAGDAAVTREVRGRFILAKHVGIVRIRCGDANFADIESLPEAPLPPA